MSFSLLIHPRIKTISYSQLDKTIKNEKDLFLILGESSAHSTQLLINYSLNEQKKNSYNLFFFDINHFTIPITDSELSEKEKQDAINEYIDFMNLYKIDSLPTIVKIKNGKATKSLGKYLDDDYIKAKKEDKNIFINKANNKVKTFLENN